MFDKNQLAGLMKKAQEMQNNIQKAQEQVNSLEVTGQSGAGMVEVIMTGKHDVKKITISETIMDDKEMLEDLIAAAINDANRKVEAESEKLMGGATAGLPAGMKFPF